MPHTYARFFKCDLHLHSPFAPSWKDDDTKLSYADDEARKLEVARIYLRACYEAKLEVIAITDHNFSPTTDDSFINFLAEVNHEIADEYETDRIAIFPGFEVQADVGLGIHVLGIFPRDTNLAVVNSRLTLLDLPEDKRFGSNDEPKQSGKKLVEILAEIQNDLTVPALIIAAHTMSSKGLFDPKRMSDWLQADEFENPDLLAIELPKPLNKFPEGIQNILGNTSDCPKEWKRNRRVACVMSSDSYSLDPSHSRNYVGYRYSWIKMTKPSIEALRQAFLDNESRIRLQVKNPQEQYTYPRINKVTVNGADFLQPEKSIEFSPNLNSIIGPRGSGKSTLIDYMRATLDRNQDEDLPEKLKDDIQDRIDRTFNKEAIITIDFEKAGTEYKLTYKNGEREIISDDGDDTNDAGLTDIRILFPCRILSQRQIDYTAGERDRTALAEFLDDFLRPQLNELERKSHRQIGEIKQLDGQIQILKEGQLRRSELSTSHQDLQNQLDYLTRLNEVTPSWQAIQNENTYFQEIERNHTKVVEHTQTYLDTEFGRVPMLPDNIDDLRNSAFLKHIREREESIQTELKETVEEALRIYKESYTQLETLQSNEWQPRFDEVEQRFRDAQSSNDHENNADLGNIDSITTELDRIKTQLSELDYEANRIVQIENDRLIQLEELRQTWKDETKARKTTAEKLMDQLYLPDSDKPSVEISISSQANVSQCVKEICEFIDDRRRLNETEIKDIVDAISQNHSENLLQIFIDYVRDKNDLILNSLRGRYDAFVEFYTEDVLRKLELIRISDKVSYIIYRRDGTQAGRIENVSAGQQGMAILNMLMASGDTPLLIDTPEEGLDNQGVYTELVQLFRQQKERRQIIVVTHNANIPVNADAEAVIPLTSVGAVPTEIIENCTNSFGTDFDAQQIQHIHSLIMEISWHDKVIKYLEKKGCTGSEIDTLIKIIHENRRAIGSITKVNATLAQGALDIKEIKDVVQNVMEGSEEAFKKRHEKYGF